MYHDVPYSHPVIDTLVLWNLCSLFLPCARITVSDDNIQTPVVLMNHSTFQCLSVLGGSSVGKID